MLIVAILLFFAIYLLIRNEYTAKLRFEILDQVSKAAQQDIIDGHFDWMWRYEKMKEVSYDRMMIQFWKPVKLEAFYKDRSFLNLKEKKNG
jgi:hypothetical protein